MTHCKLPALCGCLLLASAALAQQAGPTTAPTEPPLKLESKFDYKQIMDPLLGMIDSKDPIGRITSQMGSATELLTKLNTSAPTQPIQQEVIAGLDDFIAMLERQKKNAKSGTNPNPDSPLPDSILAKGPGGQGDMRDPNASSRLWGQLPAKQRQQILQSQTEGFPSGYEEILSSYYKRLAQENVESPAVPSAGPSTQPAPTR